MTIRLKQDSGYTISLPTGFSFTLLFFGVFVPLLRGDIKYMFIMIFLAFLTFGLSWFIFPFCYNGIWIKNKLSQGFTPADKDSATYLQKKGWIS